MTSFDSVNLPEGYELRQAEEQTPVGTLSRKGSDYFVALDQPDPRFGRFVRIPRKQLNGAPEGMKVVIKVTAVISDHDARGEIIEVLGDPGSPDVAIKGIIRYYNLREEFPEAVQREVQNLPPDPAPEQIDRELARGRTDLREQPCYTIDGLDARDLDDAIYVEQTAQGYRLYVHIADVTHYVRPDSALDKEAFARANSNYLADRVLPMLPPKLSNGLCSLNPHKDRLCLSCRLDFDETGKLVDGKLFESVIRSKLRSSYEELKTLFDQPETAKDQPDWFVESITAARALAKILAVRRERRGALNFDFPETKLVLDDAGKVQDIYGAWQDETEGIIESFMIAANEYVAAFCERYQLPVLYRVHEDPDREKLRDVFQFSKDLGLGLKIPEEFTSKVLQQLLAKLEGEPFGTTLSDMLLRSLAKARYSPDDLGHFGLASEQYCHFTAPIRRYADILVHRGVKAQLRGESAQRNAKRLSVIADHVSEMERVAIEAERDTYDQKICEYYADKLGEIYEGTLSGFSRSSMYARLTNTVEGSIFYADMDSGFIKFVPDRLMAVNMDQGTRYYLGDPVTVQIARVDLERRFLDFRLLKHQSSHQGRKK